MGSQVKISKMLCIFAILLLTQSMAAPTNEAQFHSGLENFSQNLFTKIYESNGGHNIIYSPFSIQTCLAMLRMAADGETATEMDKGLSFIGQSAESVADNYHTMLAEYENSNILNIANKVYVKQGYNLKNKYNQILSEKFFSSAENVDFGSTEAETAINDWVASKTNNIIKDLIQPGILDTNTRLFLLSAIHFKGSWETPFDKEKTKEKDFYTDETNAVKTQMMFREGKTDFTRLDDLNANAVRLPYMNSDLSMVIILPNSRNGLSALEEKLRTVKLQSLTKDKFHKTRVYMGIPKFKAELEITLNNELKKMGMNKMFEDADFSKMLTSSEPLAVSTVIHKAFIEVNEMGTEAAAVTGITAQLHSGPRMFIADHPFYYVIMNEDSIPLFQGTFVGV